MAEEFSRRQLGTAEEHAAAAEEALAALERTAHTAGIEHASRVVDLEAQLVEARGEVALASSAVRVDAQSREAALRAKHAAEVAAEHQRCADVAQRLQQARLEGSRVLAAAQKEGGAAVAAVQVGMQHELDTALVRGWVCSACGCVPRHPHHVGGA